MAQHLWYYIFLIVYLKLEDFLEQDVNHWAWGKKNVQLNVAVVPKLIIKPASPSNIAMFSIVINT